MEADVEVKMILGIQIAGVLFALFMLYMSFVRQKRKEFSGREFALWSLLWIGFIIITLFPDVLSPFTRTLQLHRKMDLLIIMGFIFLTGITFQNYIALKRAEKKLEDLVRKIAHKRAEQ